MSGYSVDETVFRLGTIRSSFNPQYKHRPSVYDQRLIRCVNYSDMNRKSSHISRLYMFIRTRWMDEQVRWKRTSLSTWAHAVIHRFRLLPPVDMPS
jgi:hypothetical protein